MIIVDRLSSFVSRLSMIRETDGAHGGGIIILSPLQT